MAALAARQRQARALLVVATTVWSLLALRNFLIGRPHTAAGQVVGALAGTVLIRVSLSSLSEKAFATAAHTTFFVAALVTTWVSQNDANHHITPVILLLTIPAAAAYMLGARAALGWGVGVFVLSMLSLSVDVVAPVYRSGPWEIGILVVSAHLFLVLTAVGARLENERYVEGLLASERLVRNQAKELATARDQALAASRAKTAFLATTSHELRTPLNGVLGMATVALDTEQDPDRRAMLRTIRESGEALLTILNDVLDLSKIEAGRLDLSNAPFAPRSVVDQVARLFSAACNNKGIALVTEVDPDLPARASGDEGRLRQIVGNLVANAVKFTERGTVTLRALLSADGSLCFEVIDTGIGIAEDRVATIFDAFTQADPSITRRFGGTGLGLTIARDLTRSMQGRITVESKVHVGSTFRVMLPLVAVDEKSADSKPESIPPSADLPLFVLVAEDDPINQKVARAMVASLGHRVDVVDTGERAVEAVTEGAYDVLLTDVRMPGMGGLEVNRQVREILPRALVPHVAAMTASAFAEERRAFTAAGMDYVAKPVSRSELAAVLERARDATMRLDESTIRGLASLVEGGGASVDGFLDELFESVRAALAVMDRAESPEAMRRAAHSLVGSAGVCGAFGISRAAMAIERVAPKGDAAETRLRVERLRSALEGTLAMARQRKP